MVLHLEKNGAGSTELPYPPARNVQFPLLTLCISVVHLLSPINTDTLLTNAHSLQ